MTAWIQDHGALLMQCAVGVFFAILIGAFFLPRRPDPFDDSYDPPPEN